MLELYSDVFMFRGIERLLIVIGGFIFAYLGYRLFLYGVESGNGKLETESPLFKLTFSGSGPGLFFMAFGGLILINSIFSSATVDRESLQSLSQSTKSEAVVALNSEPTSIVKESLKFSGETTGACDTIRLSMQGNDVKKALWAYQNAIEKTKVEEPAARLAKIIEDNIVDDAVLLELLPAIEDVICTLEQ
jgi:hypothetical protein